MKHHSASRRSAVLFFILFQYPIDKPFFKLARFLLVFLSFLSLYRQKHGRNSRELHFKRFYRLTAPGPVQFLSATSLSNINQCYAARIEWTSPTERDLNGVITHYQLHWSKVFVLVNQSFVPFTPFPSVSSSGFGLRQTSGGPLT